MRTRISVVNLSVIVYTIIPVLFCGCGAMSTSYVRSVKRLKTLEF